MGRGPLVLGAGAAVSRPAAECIANATYPQVDHLEDCEQQAEEGDHVHDQEEDGLLGGPGYKAVDGVRARRACAHVGGDDLQAVEDVLAKEEGHLEG